MSIEYAKYDRRIVNVNKPPPGYQEYINSLVCCLCGSVEKCNCIPECKIKPKEVSKPKKQVKIDSVCTPHRDWIEAQIALGTSVKDIWRGLIHKFEFRNSYTSVKDFVRKLKGLQYNASD